MVPPVVFKVVVVPVQIATLEPALMVKAFTVTVTLAVLLQPFEFVPVTVYVLVVVGLAVTLAQVVQDKPVAGDHK